MHAGSCDPLLYQHRARCTLGASRVPFISPSCKDASLCVFAGHGTGSYFTATWLSPSRFWSSPVRICLHKYVCIYVLATVCEGSDPQHPSPPSPSLLPWRIRWPVTSKGRGATRRQPARPPAKGGEILFAAGPRLAGAAADATAWLSLGPPPRQA